MSVTSNLATGKAKGSKARIVEEKTGGYKAEEKSEEQDERLRELLGDLRRVAAVEGTEEAENRQRAVKQQLLAAPSSSSSTGPTSRTLTPVATVERDREAMRVAFEEFFFLLYAAWVRSRAERPSVSYTKVVMEVAWTGHNLQYTKTN